MGVSYKEALLNFLKLVRANVRFATPNTINVILSENIARELDEPEESTINLENFSVENPFFIKMTSSWD